MKYKYYTTNTVKEPMTQSSVMWVINEISTIEEKLKNKELTKVGSHLRKDLRNVINELNQTVNELLIKN